jgi:hypothetical protein
MTSTPECGSSRLSEAFFLGICGTRSAFEFPSHIQKTGILVPAFSHPPSIDRSRSNILAVLMRGNVPSHEDALEKRFGKAKPHMTFRPSPKAQDQGILGHVPDVRVSNLAPPDGLEMADAVFI